MHVRLTEQLISFDLQPAALIGLAFMAVMVFFVCMAIRGDR